METCRQVDMRRQKPFHICVFPQAAAFHKNAHAPLTSLKSTIRRSQSSISRRESHQSLRLMPDPDQNHDGFNGSKSSHGLGQWSWSENPCCSGRWSRSCTMLYDKAIACGVLILVVVEDGLGAIRLLLVWCSRNWS